MDWTYVDITWGETSAHTSSKLDRIVRDSVDLPPGYSLAWSGQYEYMVRAKETTVPGWSGNARHHCVLAVPELSAIRRSRDHRGNTANGVDWRRLATLFTWL